MLNSILILAGVFLLGVRMQQVLPLNKWSADYARLAMNDQETLDGLPDMPKAHRRAPLWLAREAGKHGLPERALALVEPLSGTQSRDVLRIQGEAFFALGDDEKAIDVWEKAGDYQSLAKLGASAESSGYFDTAELAYRAGWKVDPTDGTLPLANFLWHVQRNPAAAEHVLRASLSSVDEKQLNWLRALGRVLQAQSRWDEAIAAFQDALILKPDDLSTFSLLGYSYLDGKQDNAQAKSIFERMIALAPTKGDGYFAMGQLMAKQGRPDEADPWFAQAIERNPDIPSWWVVRGNTAREAGEVSLSLDIYHEGLELFPDSPSLYHEMARAYQLENNPGLAIQAIEKALACQERPNAWYFVRAGEIYQWAGETSRARSAYLNALKVDQGNSAAHRAAEQYLMRLDAAGD
jgi:tetratricopeptide (TPR) repeat protein